MFFKYLKYFIPSITGLFTILAFSMGEYYPTCFFISFSLFIILGDYFFGKDKKVESFSYPGLLNFSLYINLPILFLLIIFVSSLFSHHLSSGYIYLVNQLLSIDLLFLKESFNIIDKISIIAQTGLSIGMYGTIPGHELTHRKKNKLDMFFGNWLLAFSWDCTFAIEHVYGHHKNVCLDTDPASAKRGENIYLFIFRAIYREHIDGWVIEKKRLKRSKNYFFGLHNRMLVGYFRSMSITIIIFFLLGFSGMITFLFLALFGKILLEAINYIEHYGLVRVEGRPVELRHSWNSNHSLGSLYLFNVTRHSDHHRAPNLKFWELNPCNENAPTLPYGYLAMLYLVLIAPPIYNRIMDRKLIDWDLNFASHEEKHLIAQIK